MAVECVLYTRLYRPLSCAVSLGEVVLLVLGLGWDQVTNDLQLWHCTIRLQWQLNWFILDLQMTVAVPRLPGQTQFDAITSHVIDLRPTRLSLPWSLEISRHHRHCAISTKGRHTYFTSEEPKYYMVKFFNATTFHLQQSLTVPVHHATCSSRQSDRLCNPRSDDLLPAQRASRKQDTCCSATCFEAEVLPRQSSLPESWDAGYAPCALLAIPPFFKSPSWPSRGWQAYLLRLLAWSADPQYVGSFNLMQRKVLMGGFIPHVWLFILCRSLDDEAISKELHRLQPSQRQLIPRTLCTQAIRSHRNQRLRVRSRSAVSPGTNAASPWKSTLGVKPGKHLSAEQQAKLCHLWQVSSLYGQGYTLPQLIWHYANCWWYVTKTIWLPCFQTRVKCLWKGFLSFILYPLMSCFEKLGRLFDRKISIEGISIIPAS